MNLETTALSSSSSGSSAEANLEMESPSIQRRCTVPAFPWLLFMLLGALVFPIYNEVQTPYYADGQSATSYADEVQTGNTITNRAIIISLGIIGVSLLARNRNRIRLQPAIVTVLLVFLGWSALSAFWSIDQFLSCRRLASLALMTLFSAGCAARLSAFSLSTFIAGVPILGIVGGVLFELSIGKFQPFTGEYRFCGMASHPNVQAATLSVATILLSWLCWQARGRVRVLFIIAALFVACFLVLTGSRTSIIAVMAALAFSVVLIVWRNAKPLLVVLAASLGIIISVSALVNLALSTDSTKSSLASTIHREDQGNDSTVLNGREDLWRSLLPYVAKHPWGGYGFGAFWSPQRIEEVSADQGWVIQQSHSAYIDQLLALGIPGALLYIVLLFYCIRWSASQFTRFQDGYGAWAAVLVFMAIHNATESINVASNFTNLAFYMIVAHLAIIQPTRSALTAEAATLRVPGFVAVTR